MRLRRTALGLLALASVASYYRFSFTDRIRFGMHVKDVYHYYVGSKYFAEIGYGGIYECTLAAAVESELFWVDELTQVRDLRTMQQAPARAMVERGVRECRPRFTPSRWHDFRRDLGFFFERLDGPVWQRTLLDHGYNPSPVWTLLATPVASAAPASGLPVLVHIDSLLVAGAFVAVGWAFGFEAMCLAAIVWGTGFPWRYTWLGDSFLRQLWFVSALVGVCCLRKGRAYAAGALFAVSALVRLFPAVLLAGCGLHALQRAIRERAWPAEALRVAVGAGVASLVLIGGTLVTTERGLDDYAAFHHNTSVYRDIVGANLAGLPALLWRIDGTATLQWDQDFAPASARWIHPRMSLVIRIAAALALLFLFLRASREARGWEAAAASFAFIPVLASPAGYYLEFVVLGVPLALRWPWVGVWLLSACALWLVNGLHWRPLRDQYTVVSLVAVALSFAVMATLQRRPRAVAPGSGAGARDDANRDRPAAEVQDARAIGSNSENPST